MLPVRGCLQQKAPRGDRGSRKSVRSATAAGDGRRAGQLPFHRHRCDRRSASRRRSRAAETKWGRLDAIVACAGVSGEGAAVDITADQWDHVMAVNGKGVFLFGKFAIPAMLRRSDGSLTNISSAYGRSARRALRPTARPRAPSGC